jgi:two-component system CheB/CheR fusion protein
MSDTKTNPELEALLVYLRQSRGFDFSGYKRPSLMRRIQRRMQMVNIEGYTNYIDYLEVHPDEFVHLFNTILINVTGFFRDQEVWGYIINHIVPQILASKTADEPIRIWSAGCASGEEAYTLAIVLAEAVGIEAFRERVKIFATDIDEEALSQSRYASYSAKDVAEISPELLTKYFEFSGHHYVFNPELRRCVIFGRHNLVQDAPISRIDLLLCRNILMYFNTETQSRITERFHFALNNNGFLVMGKAEMLFNRSSSFTVVDLKQRIFTKSVKESLRDRLVALAQSPREQTATLMPDYTRIQEAAFDTDPVAQIVVNRDGVMILANDQARSLFGLSTRDLGRPLQNLELSYRPVDLRSCLDQIYANQHPILLKEIHYPSSSLDSKYLDVHLLPLLDNDNNLLGVKIIFADVTRYRHLQEKLQFTNQELETAYEELQSTNEELETTNEELQSTIEELETTNEELQSTNEELETMNEELQSTNEELYSINDELRQRSDQLNQVNGFLESILSSLRSGVVVLDQHFHIKIWNYRAVDLWGLRENEVQGSHFLNLDIGLPVEPLRGMIRSCLNGDSAYEEITLDAINRRGKAIQCQVICTPLTKSGPDVTGVILLMEATEL